MPALLTSVTSAASRAGAETPSEADACIEAADRGQLDRDEGRFQSARPAFERCARETCPDAIREDCARWLQELDANMPTVLLRAEDDRGRPRPDAQAWWDGVHLGARLDGQPIPVDPGTHSVRFEAPDVAPTKALVVVRVGEKARAIVLQFAPQAPPKAPPQPPLVARAVVPATVTPPTTPPPTRVSVPAATWIFGGVALAAFGTEAYFGLSGMTQHASDLGAGGCAPHCSDDEKSSIRAKLLVADVSLGAALASAGLATYFFFASRSPATVGGLDIHVSARRGGGEATVGGRF